MAASDSRQRHRQSVKSYLKSHSSSTLSKSTRPSKATKASQATGPLKLPLIPNKNVKQRKARIDDLPDEMLSFIFWKLPVGDLISASQVCKRWHSVTSDNLLWQKLYDKFAGPASLEKASEQPVHELKPGLWKQLCLRKCKLKRDAIYLKQWKKPDSYTCLRQRPELTLGKVGVRFELSFLDGDGTICTLDHNEMFWSYTSLTIRWYSLVFPNIKSIRDVKIYACSPLMFHGPAKPAKDGIFQKSLLMAHKLTSAGVANLTEAGSDSHVKLFELAPGLLMALYQVDGEIAFITATIHNHNLISRCLSGSAERCWSPPEPKTIEDDIDPNYADGFAVYNPVKRDDKLSHVTCLKDISLPWKTMFFKGIIRDLAILDITVVDEHGEPFWTVTSLVKVTQDCRSDQFDFNEDNYRSIRYEDVSGKILLEIGKLDDNCQYLSHASVFLSVKAINRVFKTEYPES